MPNRAALLIENLIDEATLSASSGLPLLPVSQLKNQDVGRVWRTEPATETAYILAVLVEPREIGAIVLAGYTGTSGVTVRVRVSTADPTGVAGDAFDSGVVAGVFDPMWRNIIYILPAPATGSYLRIDVAQAGADFLEAGYLMAGPLWIPSVSYQVGFEPSVEDFDQIVTTTAGVDYILEGGSRRRFTAQFVGLTEDELNTQLFRISNVVRRRQPILFISDLDTTNVGRDSILGRLMSQPRFPNAFPGGLFSRGYFSWTMELAELV